MTNLVYTVGHSTRSLEELIRLLQTNAVSPLVDVRSIPRSRRNPQFNRETLPASLADAGIGYRHLAALGGLRHARRDSPNKGWRNASFQGFADYMQTSEFETGLAELIEVASRETVAIMCAEAVPWRCHRSLIADALTVRGIRVEHIIGASRNQPHILRTWARVEGTRITYPAQEDPVVEFGRKSPKESRRGNHSIPI